MGYTTTFEGELKFTSDMGIKSLQKLKLFLGEDCRDHPEWNSTHMSYIDLQLTDDFSGLKWDGSEKTYDLEEKINLIIREMKKEFPDFGLTGSFKAQGEDAFDIWILSVKNNKAIREEIVISGNKVTCPNCHEEFILQNE